MALAYERLDVYRYATEHLALAVRVTGGSQRPPAFLVDQYRRAALSIPLNIAEAVGKNSSDDQKRFFAIARGSAMECGAILDAAAVLGVVDDFTLSKGKELLEHIVRILSVLCFRGRRPAARGSAGTQGRRRGRG